MADWTGALIDCELGLALQPGYAKLTKRRADVHSWAVTENMSGGEAGRVDVVWIRSYAAATLPAPHRWARAALRVPPPPPKSFLPVKRNVQEKF